MSDSIPRVLSIAGSDSGGGAGIQADLKAFAACGVHGMTAVTAITAQNTVGVTAVHPIPPEMIVAQIEAVLQDIGIDAVKIGMLGDAASIRAVGRGLALLAPEVPVVLDPVMVAESGARLLDPPARATLIDELLPQATVMTPNLPEARALLGLEDTVRGPQGAVQEPDVPELARRLLDLGPRAVVITGGHRERVTDVLWDGSTLTEIPGERHADGAGHGSGCTHSSVLAARLAWGDGLAEAARAAKQMAARAVRDGLRQLGAGAGPVNVLGLGRGRPDEPGGLS